MDFGYCSFSNINLMGNNMSNYKTSLFSRLLKKFTLLDLLKGLRVTGGKLFSKKTTIQFPEEKLPKSIIHRGVVVLRRFPKRKGQNHAEERCIGCKLCEATCPPQAITIETEVRSDGSRRTKRFDIDVFKCINCGLCEAACPVDSIVCHQDGTYTIDKRGDNIMTKQTLLALGDQFESDIAKNKILAEEGSQ